MGTRRVRLALVPACVAAGLTASEPLLCTVRDVTGGQATGPALSLPCPDTPAAAGFVVRAAQAAVPRGSRTEITVTDNTGAEREITVEVVLRLAEPLTHMLATDGQGVREVPVTGTVAYRSQLALPALTLFSADIGVTVAAPFDIPAPTLSYRWHRTETDTEVRQVVANLRLPAGGKACVGVLVGRHEGCWRPGLGWLADLYPEYFRPPNPKVRDYDGPMIYDFVTTEERLRRDLQQDLAWQELGWYWPHLGLYKPDAESWRRQPSTEGGLGQGGEVTTRLLNEYIAMASRLGVAQCLYFQSTESWADFAESRFPADRVRSADGKLAPTWIKCVVMNPDPDRPFGAHILDQLQRLLESFPGMAGVFWDQNCYTGFDFAHDDGLSMANGRRVAMLEFPQNAILAAGSKLLHDRGKVIFTNGGWTAGLARYCDGHMSEGTGPTRRLQYLCMNKHLTLLCYDNNVARGLEKVKLALETGAQPSVTLGNEACREFFAPYRPIFRLLRGKQWVFQPHALTLPAGLRGNLFRNGEGNYIVTLVGDEADPRPIADRVRPVQIEARLPGPEEPTTVLAWGPLLAGYRAPVVRSGPGVFRIEVPAPDPCGVVILARHGRWVLAEPHHLIAGRPTELTIVLANLTPVDWEGEWRIEVGDQTLTRTAVVAGGQTGRLALGPVSAGPGRTTLRLWGPAAGTGTEAWTIDVPVVTAAELVLPTQVVPQVRRGEPVPGAIVNHLDSALEVVLHASWVGPDSPSLEQKLCLAAGEVRPLPFAAEPPRGGQCGFRARASWSEADSQDSMTIEVIEGTLPRDFKAEDTEELVLHLDVFNSLGGQWENKPVTVNGVVVGNLPVTGQTLRWHEAMPLKVTGGPAREIVSRGVRPDGAVEMRVEIGNEVRNCFKLRNAVAVIRTHGGGVVQSVRSRAVHCSDPGWLYSEGAAVPLGRTVGVGPVRFERQE